MKFVYILEDDPRFQREMVDAIATIDPKIQVRLFPQLEFFGNWMKLMVAEGVSSIVKGGQAPSWLEPVAVPDEEHKLVMVVSKIEFLGAKQINLLKKTRESFIKKNICTKEDPTAFVLTAFDDPGFKIRELEDRILNNIIFKPFDRLILLQHLTFAIDGRHPPSKYSIQNQKTSAVFEMLKAVPIVAVSETGFITSSDRPIEVGGVSKYYGGLFETERHRSIMAITDFCIGDTSVLGKYHVGLRFFAIDPVQISKIRKFVRRMDLPVSTIQNPPFSVKGSTDPIDIVIIDKDEHGANGIGGTLARRFKYVNIVGYNDFAPFYLDLDPSQKTGAAEPPKPFVGSGGAFFEIDPNTGVLLNATTAEGAKLETVFGHPNSIWKDKSQWLSKMLNPHSQERWRLLLWANTSLDLPKETLYNFETGDNSFIVRFESRDRTPKSCILKFSEISKEERLTYLSKQSRLPLRPLAIFINHNFMSEKPVERWTPILEQLKKRSGGSVPKLFVLASNDYSDAQERELATIVTDIYAKPIDRAYLVTKFHSLFPNLKVEGDPVENRQVTVNEVLKVANPIKIKEFSEAGFIMEYYRSISIGSFREVLLWQPYEIGAPEMVSTCNFTEEVQGKKGVFSNHFVLFGMTDYFLKTIRVWIRNNYILSKEK